jgi:hypothetical protein
MKAKLFMVIFVVSTIIVTDAFQKSAQSQSDIQLKKFYESYIAGKITKCQSKTLLKISKSKNLRLTAEKAAEQARFLKLNRDKLVNEMMEQDIGQKPYKIEHYLNSRFYKIYE